MGDAAEEHCHDVFKLTLDTCSPVQAAAVRVLSMIGSNAQHYASVISTMLSDTNSEVTCAVLEALGNMGAPGKACAEEVEEYLGSSDPVVRAAATAALENMGILMSPFLKDFGRGPDKSYWRTGDDRPAGTLLPGDSNFGGLGVHYGELLAKKDEQQASGKWISGVF